MPLFFDSDGLQAFFSILWFTTANIQSLQIKKTESADAELTSFREHISKYQHTHTHKNTSTYRTSIAEIDLKISRMALL